MPRERGSLYTKKHSSIIKNFWTFLGSFLGIGIIGFAGNSYLTVYDNMFLIGSFGASSVLMYGAINSPMAQPRNLIRGHIISG